MKILLILFFGATFAFDSTAQIAFEEQGITSPFTLKWSTPKSRIPAVLKKQGWLAVKTDYDFLAVRGSDTISLDFQKNYIAVIQDFDVKEDSTLFMSLREYYNQTTDNYKVVNEGGFLGVDYTYEYGKSKYVKVGVLRDVVNARKIKLTIMYFNLGK